MTSAEWGPKIDKAVFPGSQGGPLMHVIAAKAVAFHEALQPEFKQYQQAILDNAQALAKALIQQGVPLVSGGTDNHLMLVDLRQSERTGKELEQVLGEVQITVNKNTVPNDPRSPFVTSGLRLGTPAVTSRGFQTQDMSVLAECLAKMIEDPHDTETRSWVQSQVATLCEKHPLYS